MHDPRVYPDSGAAELAAACVESAAEEGLALILTPNTPVIPDEDFPFHNCTPVLTERTRWGDIEGFMRRLGDVGCSWVNLRFSMTEHGEAVIRYEALPDGEPLPEGRIAVANGGFDGIRRVD